VELVSKAGTASTRASVSAAPFRYPGAKAVLADWIISHFPSHETYVEPYFGSGAVFFKKTPSRSEYVNDLNSDVVRFFRVLRTQGDALAEAVALTPYSREEYLLSMELTDDDLEFARRFVMRHQMSIGGNGGARYATGWRHNGVENCHGGVIRGWRKLPERFLQCMERLQDAHIENRDAVQLIERLNGLEVLVYADPPYPDSVRSKAGKGARMYAVEMMDDPSHAVLLTALMEHEGMVVLSGYACEMYDDTLTDWMRVSRKSVAEMGQAREEVLWINPKAAARLTREAQRRALAPVSLFEKTKERV
jgi:DNA adenine methylase